ncbi:MAG TPA: universal stress protein [Solirubrobacteraceae bacterium]
MAVGVSPYPEGEDAAVLGTVLAKAAAADLMLMSVEPDLPLIVPGFSWKAMRAQTEQLLHRVRDSYAPDARLKIETDLAVWRGVERFVRREHRELLVIGSSRHAPEGTVLIGKHARQLFEHLHGAVAIAPRGYRNHPEARLRRIGVGCDGEPESLAALAVAAQLAAGAGAELSVHGVIDDRVPALGWREVWMGAILEAWQEVMASEADLLRQKLDTAVAEIGTKATVEVTMGRPADALHALSRDVDLLVLGSRRWGPVARLFLGGTGEALAHGAHCPLVLVPKPELDD